jgi:hypothetical protein
MNFYLTKKFITNVIDAFLLGFLYVNSEHHLTIATSSILTGVVLIRIP